MFTEVSDIKKTNLHKLSNQNELFFLFLHVSLSFTTTWLTLILTRFFFIISNLIQTILMTTYKHFPGGGQSHLDDVNSVWPRLIGRRTNSLPLHPLPWKRSGKRKKNSVIKLWVMSGSHGWHPPPLFLSPPLSNCFHCLSFFFSFALILFSLAFFTSLSIPQPL